MSVLSLYQILYEMGEFNNKGLQKKLLRVPEKKSYVKVHQAKRLGHPVAVYLFNWTEALIFVL